MNFFSKLRYISRMVFKNTIDIHSGAPGVIGRLSNFTKREFVFDGVSCRSIEGVLQSFKFEDIDKQSKICALYGMRAKRAGLKKHEWKEDLILYWQRKAYERTREDYQLLLGRLYESVYAQDEGFRRDIQRCRNRILVHSVGINDVTQTVLTETELCERLKKLSDKHR